MKAEGLVQLVRSNGHWFLTLTHLRYKRLRNPRGPFRIKTKLRLCRRIVLTLLATGFIIYSASAFYIYQYGQTDHAAPADAIIVLGGGVNRNGSATDAERRRASHGAALFKQGLAPYVICTGGYDSPQHAKTV